MEHILTTLILIVVTTGCVTTTHDGWPKVSAEEQDLVETFINKVATAGDDDGPFRFLKIHIDGPKKADPNIKPSEQQVILHRGIGDGGCLADFKPTPTEVTLFLIDADNGKDHWDGFVRKFPKSHGYLYISRLKLLSKETYSLWCTHMLSERHRMTYQFRAEKKEGQWTITPAGMSM